jgi:RRXRR protein
VVQINTVSVSKETHTKPVRAGIGRLKTTEPAVRGRAEDIRDASQVPFPSAGQPRREKLPVKTERSEQSPVLNPVWVPVISSTGSPLMPCRPAYARALIKSGRAQRRWFKGIFAIKMLDRAEGKVQQVVCGIDPGSKREAFTVQSKQHTYLNVLSNAVGHIKDRMETRRRMRLVRRARNTPCRKNKYNRTVKNLKIPPSTKSRWQIKLNILKFLKKLYPVTNYVIEDIKAKSKKNCKKWNSNFSPLEVGKTWFYSEISKIGNLITKQGYETFEKRNLLGLKKSDNKLSETFDAHNVDSWLLSSFVTGKSKIDNTALFRIIPFQLYRRQLHRMNFSKKGIKRFYGGTISIGLKRGSMIRHKKFGMAYIGGTQDGRVTLHNIKSGERIIRNGRCEDIEFLYFSPWRTQSL